MTAEAIQFLQLVQKEPDSMSLDDATAAVRQSLGLDKAPLPKPVPDKKKGDQPQ